MGALSNKGGRGQRNREEIGAEATTQATKCASCSKTIPVNVNARD